MLIGDDWSDLCEPEMPTWALQHLGSVTQGTSQAASPEPQLRGGFQSSGKPDMQLTLCVSHMDQCFCDYRK